MHPSSSGVPEDRLAAELRTVQRKGIARLTPQADCPALLQVARSQYPQNLAPKTAIRKLLQDQTETLGDSLTRRTLVTLYGLDPTMRGQHPTTLRALAAAIWGLEPTSFRRVPMQTLIADLADAMVSQLDLTAEELTVAMDPPAETVPARKAAKQPQLKLAIGTSLDGSDNYRICNPDGTDRKAPRGKSLDVGGGGAGTVYCARFKNAQLRAVKFLTSNALNEAQSGRHATDFAASFGREIDILYKLSHGNIARLHDSGTYRDGQFEWPYLVTEFIGGPMLKDALDDQSLSGEEIYRIFREIIDAVRYLHRNDVYHGDIKHENIKMRRVGTGTSDAVLLDLGAAHWLGDTEAESQRRFDDSDASPRYRFISTKHITHERFRPHLAGGYLSRDDLQGIMPKHDLYTLGFLMNELIGQSPGIDTSARERLRRVIGDSGLLVLDEIITDLMNVPETHIPSYDSIEQVAADWEKLHPNYLSPAGTPELSLAAEFSFSLITATGRTVITPRLSRVVNHKLTQRLRDIQQLEYTSLKFGGATHTRLSHSAAVLNNTRYYLAHLLNEAKFRRMVEPSDLQATLLLAVLHDVGHFQLSHMFEDFAADQRPAKDSDPWAKILFDIPTDDDLFTAIVAPNDSNVNVSLRGDYQSEIQLAREASEQKLGLASWSKDGGSTSYHPLRDVIEEGFGREAYLALIAIHQTIYARPGPANPNPAHLVLGGVISSDIDADKTAYLVEDSIRSGVPYGAGVDLDGILGNLCVPSADDLSDTTSPILGIARTGVTAAQSVAVARNQMLTTVYWNRSNRAATAMVKYVVARLLQKGKLDMREYIRSTFFQDRAFAMTYLMNLYRQAFPDRPIIPIAGLLEAERRLYKPLFETSSLDKGRSEAYSEKLLQNRYTEIIDLEDKIRLAISKDAAFGSLVDGEILIDVPSKEREKPSGERGGSVIVYDQRPATGRGIILVQATPIMSQLKEQHRALNRVCRVFIAPHRTADAESMRRASVIAKNIVTASIGE